MTTTRGRARMDCKRAAVLAKHIQARMDWQIDTYKDYPDYALGCEVVLKSAMEMEKLLDELVKLTP